MGAGGFGAIAAAGPMFFFAAWLTMIFAGVVGDEIGINAFGYVDAMKVTIGLWLAAAPLVGAASAHRWK
ncbi:MAG: hypothetical protein H6Q11_462 [Acidobacteria bacterium]|jgi:hypothetical protein|nr:hypothetical protein [Acidobacteriota bacterium]